jgi:hypothetical protein
MNTKPEKLQPLPPHRFAKLFPAMSDEEFRNLVDDIAATGQRIPITTIEEDGTVFVLEGIHRQKACLQLGIEPKRTPYQRDDPLGFVLSANLHRRNMNPSQLAQLGADLADLPPGRPGKDATLQRSRKAVAALLGVSERSIADATKVKKDGDPALVEAVKVGDVSVSTAAQLAKAPKAEQREVLAKAKSQPKLAAKMTIKAAATKAAAKKKGKVVPKVKTAANGKATEPAAPNAKAFKEAAAAFASSAEHLFGQRAMAIIEHPKLPTEQRNLVTRHLLHVIKRAKKLHAKLEGTAADKASTPTNGEPETSKANGTAEPTDAPTALSLKPSAKSKAKGAPQRRGKP